MRAPLGWWLGAAVLLAACSTGTAPAPFTPSPVVVQITEIEPALGDIAGGVEVEIRGQGLTDFLEEAVVTFGAADAEIVSASKTVIRVLVPVVSAPGVVDVTVANDYGADTLSGAFTYEANTPMYGAYVDIAYMDIINPDQFDPPYNDRIYGFAKFFVPEAFPFYTAPGATDTCYFGGGANYPEVTGLDAGPQIELALPGRTVPYAGVANEYMIAGDGIEDPTLYVQNGNYDLTAPGGQLIDAFSIGDIMHPKGTLQVTSPAIEVWDPTTGYTTHPPGQDLTITWTTSESDQFYIQLIGFAMNGNYANESILCYVVDDGSFTVPGATIEMMNQSFFLSVELTRVTVTEFDFAPTASIGQAAAWETDVGTLVLQ